MFPQALLLLCTAVPAAAASDRAPHLVVERGSARVMTLSGEDQSVTAGGHMRAPGSFHLEVEPGSEAILRWHGLGTLHLTGPTSLELAPRSGAQVVHLHRVKQVVGEVRRPGLVLVAPGAWRLEPDSQAFTLAGQAAGHVQARLDAGAPLGVRWLGDGSSRVRPEQWIPAGRSLALAAPRPRTTPESEGLAWSRFDWPWRAKRDLRIDVRPLPRVRPRVHRAAQPDDSSVASTKTEAETVQVTVEELSPAVDAPRAETQPDLEGGLSFGEFQIEASPFVELRRYPNGRARVLLRGDAPQAVWCLVNGEPRTMEPGGILALDTNGRVAAIYGVLGHGPARSGD